MKKTIIAAFTVRPWCYGTYISLLIGLGLVLTRWVDFAAWF